MFARFKELGRAPSNDLDIKRIVQPLADAVEEYTEIVIEGTADAVERGMRRAVIELNKMGFGQKSLKAKIGFDFIEEFSPEISKQIKEQTFVASQRTMERLTGNVMDNLRESYEEGYGYSKAGQMLDGVFTDMETYELERVARTEIASNENLGMYESEKELGVEYHKWRTGRDEIVRDSHQDMDGEIVRVGDPFSIGLYYPGDRKGHISEWINCRCTMMPYIIPEGYRAPNMLFFHESDLISIEQEDKEFEEQLMEMTENEPEHLNAFSKEMDRWLRGVESEGRENAAFYFENFPEVRDYLRADLLSTMRDEPGWKFSSMNEFLKSKITLYRVGTPHEGYSSFFLTKEQAISYAKRMNVDMIFSYVTEGENIIPTMSGANEVFANTMFIERIAEIPY